jgi:hypothetical protein
MAEEAKTWKVVLPARDPLDPPQKQRVEAAAAHVAGGALVFLDADMGLLKAYGAGRWSFVTRVVTDPVDEDEGY